MAQKRPIAILHEELARGGNESKLLPGRGRAALRLVQEGASEQSLIRQPKRAVILHDPDRIGAGGNFGKAIAREADLV